PGQVRALAALLVTSCATGIGATRVDLTQPHDEPDLVSVRHTVEKGQTLYRIARTYGLTVDELMAVNGIEDPTTLRVGQQLLIPGSGAVKPVAENDSPEPEAPRREPAPPPKKGPVKVGRAEGT